MIIIVLWLDLQLLMQSVPITTKVVSSNPADGEMYLIQHYVIKFVSDLIQHYVIKFVSDLIQRYVIKFVSDLIQRYVIKFVSDLRQVSGFLLLLWFPPPIKLTDRITEILLKVV